MFFKGNLAKAVLEPRMGSAVNGECRILSSFGAIPLGSGIPERRQWGVGWTALELYPVVVLIRVRNNADFGKNTPATWRVEQTGG